MARIAARVLGLEKELGTVEEGKVADLVLVKGSLAKAAEEDA